MTSFWNDPVRLNRLHDPPSPELLERIQTDPYRGGFEPGRDNIAPYPLRITYGSIPADLRGTFASNGAGRIRIRQRQYNHWFDGDGYVTILSLDGVSNKAYFTARYVRSKRFQEQEKLMENMPEEETKPPLATPGAWTLGGRGKWYENMFQFPTSPLNTAVLWLPPKNNLDNEDTPRLYALCEGGSPLGLDPRTLEPMGEEQPFQSSTATSKQEQVSSFFSAHFSKDPLSGDIFNHGYCIRPGPLPDRKSVV